MKKLDADLCEKCPARKGYIFHAALRGSSFRGRIIEDGERFHTERIQIEVGGIAVSNIAVANTDKASREQDARFIEAIFEEKIAYCTGPTMELMAENGLQTMCSPVNIAADEFMKVNYEG